MKSFHRDPIEKEVPVTVKYPEKSLSQMIPYPDIRPYIFKIGPFEIRWYGLMYIFGFLSSYFLFRHQVKKRKLEISREAIESLYFYMILGLIVGARLGYVVFYDLSGYFRRPLEVFALWHGGMSFHGGLIGAVLAIIIFTWRKKQDFWLFSDLIVVSAPIGLFFGRIGNFVNGELYGRPSDVPWAMVFPGGGDSPRHPSQIYEALLEGVLLFIILWLLKDKTAKKGLLGSIFLVLYGALRFSVEFLREPDVHLGLVLGPFSMGQVLSAAMILVGAGIYFLRRSAR